MKKPPTWDGLVGLLLPASERTVSIFGPRDSESTTAGISLDATRSLDVGRPDHHDFSSEVFVSRNRQNPCKLGIIDTKLGVFYS